MNSVKVEPGHPLAGTLRYRAADYAFATEPRPVTSGASLTINEIELMLDDSARVVAVEGYCPYPGWRKSVLRVPVSRPGILQAIRAKALTPGVAVAIRPTDDRWPVLVDPESGWVRLGDDIPENDCDGVEFAPGAIAVLDDSGLRALWLHPEELPPL